MRTTLNQRFLNTREFKRREGCRKSAYLEEEKAYMKPLPNQRYELATWNPNLTVGSDYLVSDGKNKYLTFGKESEQEFVAI